MPRDSTPKQPAIEFEGKHSVSGIAGAYKFPDESGLDRLSLQYKVWEHYDTLTDPEILAERLKRFGTAIGNPTITSQELEGNENLLKAFGTFIEQHEHVELTHILGKLEALNPEQVAKIRFDRTNPKHLSDVLHGMVSGFNPDDINHYLDRFNGAMSLKDLERTLPEMERRALESRILQKLGIENEHTIGWVASPPTLEKIWEQVKDRPIAALAEGIEKAASRVHL